MACQCLDFTSISRDARRVQPAELLLNRQEHVAVQLPLSASAPGSTLSFLQQFGPLRDAARGTLAPISLCAFEALRGGRVAE